ncbi:MAG: trehalose-phosphatase [Deltaproteobacteria bacterium]|nr:trehalose-phosphatase [Deltaproteobacteria bacterium]
MAALPVSLWKSPWPERLCRTFSRIFLCLDYDGTLAPIATRPEDSRPTDALLKLLTALVNRPNMTVAIVSGRSLADLRGLLPLPKLVYVGTHGCEVGTANGETRLLVPGGVVSLAIARLRQDIAPTLVDAPGLFLEDKRYALALHYRLAQPQDTWAIDAFLAAVREYQRKGITLEVIHGKKVIEVRPVGSNKGKAVQFLLAGEHANTLPIYIGDDITDEEAFTALSERGLTIVVSDPPRTSAAQYYLHDTQEVLRFLSTLVA